MYKYDTSNSTFANQAYHWKTVPSKTDILQLMIVSLEIMYWRNPKKHLFLKIKLLMKLTYINREACIQLGF